MIPAHQFLPVGIALLVVSAPVLAWLPLADWAHRHVASREYERRHPKRIAVRVRHATRRSGGMSPTLGPVIITFLAALAALTGAILTAAGVVLR